MVTYYDAMWWYRILIQTERNSQQSLLLPTTHYIPCYHCTVKTLSSTSPKSPSTLKRMDPEQHLLDSYASKRLQQRKATQQRVRDEMKDNTSETMLNYQRRWLRRSVSIRDILTSTTARNNEQTFWENVKISATLRNERMKTGYEQYCTTAPTIFKMLVTRWRNDTTKSS